MKVNNSVVASTGPSATPGAVSAPDAGATETIPVDRVSLTNNSLQTKTAVENGVNLATTERAQRLRHLIQAVRSGTYRPNSSQLAGQLVAEAEFDSRLAKALR